MTDTFSSVEEIDGFAVYGTLRPDCGNDHVWYNLGHVAIGGFYVEGFVLVYSFGNFFPYAIKDPDQSRRVVVDILCPLSSRHYPLLLESLDKLEGYPHHFEREVVPVKSLRTKDTVAHCWMYMHHKPELLGEMIEVPFGDWKKGKDLYKREEGTKWG